MSLEDHARGCSLFYTETRTMLVKLSQDLSFISGFKKNIAVLKLWDYTGFSDLENEAKHDFPF